MNVCEFIYLKALDHELLSEYEEQMLIEKAQAGDPNARERLILCNLRLVHSVARKYSNVERGITPDDLMADGIVGLHKAIDKYDFDFGTRLSTYATLVIETHVKRSKCLEGVVHLPEDVRQEVRLINKVIAALKSEGRNVSVVSIAEQTTFPPDKIKRLMRYESDVVLTISLDQEIDNGQGIQNMLDFIPDTQSEKEYEKVEIEADLEFFLSKLPKDDRKLVEYYYNISGYKSNKEIAAEFGVLPRYIPQMLEKVMEKLRRLGKAVQGSPEKMLLAIENPAAAMTGINETIPLFPHIQETKPGKRRKPKIKKNSEFETDDTVEQLTLFDI